MTKAILTAGIIRPALCVARQHQTRALSNSTLRLNQQQQEQPSQTAATPPANTAVGDQDPRRFSGPYRPNYSSSSSGTATGGGGARHRTNSFNANGPQDNGNNPARRPNFKRPRRSTMKDTLSPDCIPLSRFQPPPNIPYDSNKALEFVDEIDWEVSSVAHSRPLYSDIAVGLGTVAPLGTVAVNDRSYITYPTGAFIAAHGDGVRSDGDIDPEVEQSLIKDLLPFALDKTKDHRQRKSNHASPENFQIMFGLTQNFQEILNPRNPINRFNNGNVKHMQSYTYEAGSNTVQEANSSEGQAEKSWKRLERLGGDYTRTADPRSQLTPLTTSGPEGQVLMKSVSKLVGQNRSLGLEDKKKLVRAVERGLGAY